MNNISPLVIAILIWAFVLAMLIAFVAGSGYTRGHDE